MRCVEHLERLEQPLGTKLSARCSGSVRVLKLQFAVSDSPRVVNGCVVAHKSTDVPRPSV